MSKDNIQTPHQKKQVTRERRIPREDTTKFVINSELVVAYSLCKRKAFLLSHGQQREEPHEYVGIVKAQASVDRLSFILSLEQEGIRVRPYKKDIRSHADALTEAAIKVAGLEAYSDALVRTRKRSSTNRYFFEPHLVVGTHKVSKDQKLNLAFAGYVMGESARSRPGSGVLVAQGQRRYRIKLSPLYPAVDSIVSALRGWISDRGSDAPPVILNQHCPTCPFRQGCLDQAEKEDSLSLLDRMTPKLVEKYNKKGIFTVHQLSYLFKPRRRKKRRTPPQPTFNVELQALALRTNKIYIDHTPRIAFHPVELFVDIEGVPEQHFHYLIGCLIWDRGHAEYRPFWATNRKEEQAIVRAFLKVVEEHPNAPLYHYGAYDAKAIRQLTTRYKVPYTSVGQRLVNVSSFVFGRVYFPSRSNRLKDLGRLVGASWHHPDASGLQSLVWRHRWEKEQDARYKDLLLDYNRSDCTAVRLLVDQLRRLEQEAEGRSDIDFTDAIHQNTTETGGLIHRAFDGILKSAHAEYRRKRIYIGRSSIRNDVREGEPAVYRFHQRCHRGVPSRANKVIRLQPKRTCSNDKSKLTRSKRVAERLITDIAFTKTGCRRVVLKYIGAKARCPRCSRYYDPPGITRLKKRFLGHHLQAWVCYLRMALRLSYRAIRQLLIDVFGEKVSISSKRPVNHVGQN